MIVKNVKKEDKKSSKSSDKWLKGCVGGLGIAVIAFIVTAFLTAQIMNGAHEVAEVFSVIVVSLIVAVIAGVIGWIVIVWQLGKREATKGSS